jgi:hypothetical protein
VTSTSTIIEPVSVECDRWPRAKSVRELEITRTTTLNRNGTCPQQFTRSTDYYNYNYRPSERVPKCQLPISECSESWEYLKELFGNWRLLKLEFDHFTNETKRCRKDGTFCHQTVESPTYALSNIGLIASWKDHLFINCTEILPYLRFQQAWGSHLFYERERLAKPSRIMTDSRLKLNDSIFRGDELSPQDLDSKLDSYYGCDVSAHEFVLLYFEPNISTTRDLCTSDGFGEYFPYPHDETSSIGLLRSAFITTIPFNAHDMRAGEEAISE